MCGPKFCSMKITAEVREYVVGMSDNKRNDLEKQAAGARKGMEEKSRESMAQGGEFMWNVSENAKCERRF